MDVGSPLRQSFVGGWNIPSARLAPSRGFVTFPFGRLDVFDDRLIFRARGAFSRLIAQREVLLSEVEEVSQRPSPGFMSKVRIRHRAGTVNWVAFGRQSVECLRTTTRRG
jgi:hypothetical protein